MDGWLKWKNELNERMKGMNAWMNEWMHERMDCIRHRAFAPSHPCARTSSFPSNSIDVAKARQTSKMPVPNTPPAKRSVKANCDVLQHVVHNGGTDLTQYSVCLREHQRPRQHNRNKMNEMNQWMNASMNEWMNKWMNEWMDECMNERMNWMKSMNEWMNEWVNEWMNEWMNEWVNE